MSTTENSDSPSEDSSEPADCGLPESWTNRPQSSSGIRAGSPYQIRVDAAIRDCEFASKSDDGLRRRGNGLRIDYDQAMAYLWE